MPGNPPNREITPVNIALSTCQPSKPTLRAHKYSAFQRTNGYDPEAGLVQASDGNFYGTTYGGGSVNAGTVFKLAPDGTMTFLASFNYTNGYAPFAELIQAADGNLYGTTSGGLSGNGTVFRITLDGQLTTLVTFNGTNGATPLAALIQASDGNLYGTTVYGGPGGRYSPGTVFRVSPAGQFNIVYAFSGTNDGVGPRASLVQAADGNLYGETSEGGAYYSGNIFKLSVPMAAVLQLPVISNGTITLTWTAVAGQTYQVESSSNLVSGVWTAIGVPVSATNGLGSASTALLYKQGFYRVGTVP